jgi:hypothetical protein
VSRSRRTPMRSSAVGPDRAVDRPSARPPRTCQPLCLPRGYGRDRLWPFSDIQHCPPSSRYWWHSEHRKFTSTRPSAARDPRAHSARFEIEDNEPRRTRRRAFDRACAGSTVISVQSAASPPFKTSGARRAVLLHNNYRTIRNSHRTIRNNCRFCGYSKKRLSTIPTITEKIFSRCVLLAKLIWSRAYGGECRRQLS